MKYSAMLATSFLGTFIFPPSENERGRDRPSEQGWDRKVWPNPSRRPIWTWLSIYLTPKRCHLKQKRLDYQPSSEKERALVNWQKLTVITDMRVFFIVISSSSPLETLRLKVAAFCHKHLNRDQNLCFVTLSEMTSITEPFMGVSPRGHFSALNNHSVHSFLHDSYLIPWVEISKSFDSRWIVLDRITTLFNDPHTFGTEREKITTKRLLKNAKRRHG